MRKQKSMNNKGFSLVELIIVIAIMAILIGVMAPQLTRYIERTRVLADTQVADSVKTAVTTALMDPVVAEAATPGIPTLPVANAALSTFTGEFADCIAEILGYADATAMNNATTGIQSELQSEDAGTIQVSISEARRVTVTIDGSHRDGAGGTDEIVVE